MLKIACWLKLTLGGRGATVDVQMSSNLHAVYINMVMYTACIRYEEHTAST
jgi:hypothetical protein